MTSLFLTSPEPDESDTSEEVDQELVEDSGGKHFSHAEQSRQAQDLERRKTTVKGNSLRINHRQSLEQNHDLLAETHLSPDSASLPAFHQSRHPGKPKKSKGMGYTAPFESITTRVKSQLRLQDLDPSETVHQSGNVDVGLQIRHHITWGTQTSLGEEAEVALALTEVCCEVGKGKASDVTIQY